MIVTIYIVLEQGADRPYVSTTYPDSYVRLCTKPFLVCTANIELPEAVNFYGGGLHVEPALKILAPSPDKDKLIEELRATVDQHWAAYCGANAQLKASRERERIANEHRQILTRRFYDGGLPELPLIPEPKEEIEPVDGEEEESL